MTKHIETITITCPNCHGQGYKLMRAIKHTCDQCKGAGHIRVIPL